MRIKNWSCCLLVCTFILAFVPMQAVAQSEADRLYAEMTRLNGEGKYSEAIPFALRFVDILKAEGATANYATSISWLAGLYDSMGQYEKAEPLFKQAMEIDKKALGENHPSYATSLHNLAGLYDSMGQYEKAEPLYKRAIEIYRKALGENHLDYATSLNFLAGLYDSMGQYEKSEPLYKQAIEIQKKALGENHPDYATSLNGLAALYVHMGQYEKAEPLYKQAMELYRKALGNNHPWYGASLNNLAALYVHMGQYEKAEPLYKQAMEILRKALGDNHPDYAASLNNMAALYDDMGQYEKAEPLYKQAIEIQKKALGGNHPDYATSLNGLANLYRIMGRYEKAEPLYKQAMEIDKKALGENHPLYATSLDNLAGIYDMMGQYEKSEPLYKRAIEIHRKAQGENHPSYATSLNNMAALYDDMGQYEKAEPLYKQAMEIRRKALGENHPSYVTSLNNLAVLYAATSRLPEALDLSLRAMASQNTKLRQVFPSLTENEKTLFLKTASGSTDRLHSLSALKPEDEAFRTAGLDCSLLRKGIILSAILEDRRAMLLSSDPAVSGIWKTLREKQAALAKIIYAGPGKEGSEAYKTHCAALQIEVETIQKQLAGKSADYASRLARTGVNTAKLSQVLPKDAALVDIAAYRQYQFKATGKELRWADWRYVCYILRAGENAPELIDLGKCDDLDPLVTDFKKDLQAKRDSEAGKKLYSLVWQKIETQLGGASEVYLSPDGALGLLSFGALSDEKGKFLVEKYSFEYLASGRDLLATGADKLSQGITVFADPDFTSGSALNIVAQADLKIARSVVDNNDRGFMNKLKFGALPGTKMESESISGLAKTSGVKTRTYLGADATEERLKQVVSPGILHLATHGFFLPDVEWKRDDRASFGDTSSKGGALMLGNPMHRSGIALAGAQLAADGKTPADGRDDGLVTAEEIVTMNLRGTDLVVLSACETGSGEAKRGDGVMGLRRAFNFAGANNLVMSLWNVPDKATSELMTAFYSRYFKGTRPVEAMRASQLDMIAKLRKETGSAPPYYWGAFVVGR